MFTHLKSAEAWITVEGRLPVNLKFIIEGEEEVGSESLEQFLAEHADRLACDCVVISDGSQFAPGVPAITYGLRGIAYYELRVTGPSRDLHSGSFGGSVTNPANALAQMLAGLIDERGGCSARLLRRRFADDRRANARKWRRCPSTRSNTSSRLAWRRPSGEEGYTTLERRWARPTFDINGLWSGYQGEGAKTVLPASAGAKFSFRLVPNQDPAKITAALKRRLAELCSAGHQNGADRSSRRAGRGGAAGQPLHGGRGPGDRARLRPPARLHPRRRLDSHRVHLPRAAGSRYPAVGLGARRRQHPQPQREVLPGRFPSRHQGQRRLWEEMSKCERNDR